MGILFCLCFTPLMPAIDGLKQLPSDYQKTYCWARAVEWQMWIAFIAQPLLPPLYIMFPWRRVLLILLGLNFIWNLLLCTAFPMLDWAIIGLQWTRVKWVTIVSCSVVFMIHRQWLLLTLSIFTPLIAPLIGNVIIRRPTGLIQEFFMLRLGHVAFEPRPQILKFLERNGISHAKLFEEADSYPVESKEDLW
jgi:hypothetical protein